MSMHLHHPALSLNGKKKGKPKFASAAAKRQQQELKDSWEASMKQWQSMSKVKPFKPSPRSAEALVPRIPPGRETRHIPSLDTGHTGAVNVRQTPQYTGTKIIGIGTMHKSNAVPIFSDEEAKDISRMRR